MTDKKYGLILSEKGKHKTPKFQAARNVFGNDSDSEEETHRKRPILLRPSDIIKRQTKITQQKAVTEDPTVYQYDEIYEEIVGTKEKEQNKIKEEKKPRYIENLLKTANKRKIENERRMERQIQKEREQEGEEFKDKEVFVTTAYKKKLEEMHREEEKEKREEYLERIGDVTKQHDLGGFYRHLYEQKLGTDKPTISNKLTKSDKDNIEKSVPDKKLELQPADATKKRNYRKRKSADNKDLSEGEIEDSDEEINRLNLENIRLSKKTKPNEENIDADSDFSVDDPSEEEAETKVVTKEKKLKVESPTRSATPEITPVIEKQEKKSNKKQESIVEAKPKIDIWKKRTVGEVFEQALKRYYERKANRA